MAGGPAYSAKDRERIMSHILAEVSTGRPVSRIVEEDEGMPSRVEFWTWMRADPDLANSLTLARECGAETHVDDAHDIAKNCAATKEAVAVARLQVDTLLKLAAMLKPKKYGPKLDVTSDGKSISLAAELDAARRRAAEGTGED